MKKSFIFPNNREHKSTGTAFEVLLGVVLSSFIFIIEGQVEGAVFNGLFKRVIVSLPGFLSNFSRITSLLQAYLYILNEAKLYTKTIHLTAYPRLRNVDSSASVIPAMDLNVVYRSSLKFAKGSLAKFSAV